MKKVCAVFLAFILLTVSIPINSFALSKIAENNFTYKLNEETEAISENKYGGKSLDDWTYSINEEIKSITLSSYVGSDSNVYVPATFTVDGETYNTVVTSNISAQKSTFSDNTDIISITFADGVTADCMSFMFKNCHNLRYINKYPEYNGAWWTSTFVNCSNLIEAPQIPNIENIRLNYFFSNCKNLLGNYILPDSINPNYSNDPFTGCANVNQSTNVVWFGDSITSGTTTKGVSFVNFLRDDLYDTGISNYGVGGHTLSYGYDRKEEDIEWSIINDIGKFGVHKNVDYVFISAGTNDFAHRSTRRPLGTYRFADIGSADDKSPYTVSGAIYTITQLVKEKFPNAKIVFTTPITRCNYDVEGAKATDNSPFTIHLKDYVEGMKAAFDENNVDYIDTYTESGFDVSKDPCDGTGYYCEDQTHPTIAGQEELGNFYLKKLIEKFGFQEKQSTEHNESNWIIDLLATCTTNGSKHKECSDCNEITETVIIPAIGHDYSTDFIIDTEPTCTLEGSKSKHCSRCDIKTEVTIIPKAAHEYTNGICTVCGIVNSNGWVLENNKWAFYKDGNKLTNQWVKDSLGWCYVGADGYCVTNKWVKDSVTWCYLGADGYCVTNKWVKDSHDWCYLGADGRMVTNKWVKDSVTWCYIGADGYCVTNQWKADSKGWCYLGADGRMMTNSWLQWNGNWYYLDNNGYMVTGTKVINGKTYKFASNGVLIG